MKHTDQEIEDAARRFEEWADSVDPARSCAASRATATAYLMSSPLNARCLLDSIDRLENGGGTVHDLIED